MIVSVREGVTHGVQGEGTALDLGYLGHFLVDDLVGQNLQGRASEPLTGLSSLLFQLLQILYDVVKFDRILRSESAL